VIRDLVMTDVPWVLTLAHERYPDFDPGAALLFLTKLVSADKDQALGARDDHGFLIAHVIWPMWNPKQRECYVVMVCAEIGHHWEAVRLLRHSLAWAHEVRCSRWWFWSETDHRIDQLAKRVGARNGSMRYLIELKEQ
jgi:hypothetical protein